VPAIQPEELVAAITAAIGESGYQAHLVSAVRHHPRKFIVTGPNQPSPLAIYAWTLTFGGRPSLANEYRIQMTGVKSPLEMPPGATIVLLGYEPTLKLFAGFDLERHRKFTTGSPSVQIDRPALQRAEAEGLSFHRKSNDEIAVGIRPDMFMAYAMNATVLHRYGKNTHIRRLLDQAVQQEPMPAKEVAALPAERRRVVTEVSRLSRDAQFRRRVIFAYGKRCAVTRIQLNLVDAAHILPASAEGSSDHVQNGIALSPTYHRAFDAGLIYLDDQCRMRLNDGQARLLQQLDLAGGIEAFRQPLGQIFLPPDPAQHPSPDFIRRANQFRGVS
jgi:putative restriction endonuclease